jgi:hypothetical protein
MITLLVLQLIDWSGSLLLAAPDSLTIRTSPWPWSWTGLGWHVAKNLKVPENITLVPAATLLTRTQSDREHLALCQRALPTAPPARRLRGDCRCDMRRIGTGCFPRLVGKIALHIPLDRRGHYLSWTVLEVRQLRQEIDELKAQLRLQDVQAATIR